jgi:hypothetical protein
MPMAIVMRVISLVIINMASVSSPTNKRVSTMVGLFVSLGQWENGVKHGEGTYLYLNKDTYAGWWQFGKK